MTPDGEARQVFGEQKTGLIKKKDSGYFKPSHFCYTSLYETHEFPGFSQAAAWGPGNLHIRHQTGRY